MNRLLLNVLVATILATTSANAATPIYIARDRITSDITYGDVLAWHARHAATAPTWIQGTDVFIPNPFDLAGSRVVARYTPADASRQLSRTTPLRLASFVMPDVSARIAEHSRAAGPFSDSADTRSEARVVYRPRIPWWGKVLGWLAILGGIAIVAIHLAIHILDRRSPRRPEVASSSDVLAELADASDDALRSAQDEFAAAMAFLHSAFRETAR